MGTKKEEAGGTVTVSVSADGKRGKDQIRQRKMRKEKRKKDESKNCGPLPMYAVFPVHLTQSAWLPQLFFRS
jgi:hypothetical protein